EPLEQGMWGLAGRIREAWKARGDHVESEAAALGDLRGVRHALLHVLRGVSAEDVPEICARLEVMLRIRVQITLRLVERGAMTNGREDVVQSVTLGRGV